jgi:hypothetical protein
MGEKCRGKPAGMAGPLALFLFLVLCLACSIYLPRSSPILVAPAAVFLLLFAIASLSKADWRGRLTARTTLAFVAGFAMSMAIAPTTRLLQSAIEAFNMGALPGIFASFLILLAYPWLRPES